MMDWIESLIHRIELFLAGATAFGILVPVCRLHTITYPCNNPPQCLTGCHTAVTSSPVSMIFLFTFFFGMMKVYG